MTDAQGRHEASQADTLVATVPADVIVDAAAIVPTKATKAYVGAAAAGIVAAGTSLVGALSDNVVTPAEWLNALIALIVGAGLTGGGVWATTTKAK